MLTITAIRKFMQMVENVCVSISLQRQNSKLSYRKCIWPWELKWQSLWHKSENYLFNPTCGETFSILKFWNYFSGISMHQLKINAVAPTLLAFSILIAQAEISRPIGITCLNNVSWWSLCHYMAKSYSSCYAIAGCSGMTGHNIWSS